MGLARIRCSKELLGLFLRGDCRALVNSSAPADLEVIEVRECKHIPYAAVFVVRSEEFTAELQELQPPPLIDINFSEIPGG